MKAMFLTGMAIAIVVATPATAGEVFGGLYVHGVDTPLTLGGSPEGGVDVQLGYRGEGITGLKLEPYVFGALNTSGDTSYAAVAVAVQLEPLRANSGSPNVLDSYIGHRAQDHQYTGINQSQ